VFAQRGDQRFEPLPLHFASDAVQLESLRKRTISSPDRWPLRPGQPISHLERAGNLRQVDGDALAARLLYSQTLRLRAGELMLADMTRSERPDRADKSAAVLAQLDAIEAEMRRIGFWAEDPPDLLAQVESGQISSYLDAPSFELWLQCIFLPNARAAAREGDLPEESQVGLMALRQYDYHSHVEEAQPLLQLLYAFDAIIEDRR
jgi:uncharacterized protein YqcC (DUF446 family)